MLQKETSHLAHIESLRAIAALLVLIFHMLAFQGDYGFFVTNPAIRNMATFGAQGVELFYMISGFVIYFSFQNSNMNLNRYPVYIVKRFLRIFPPFWGVVLMIVLLAACWNTAYPYSFKTILLNLTLGVDFTRDIPWLNPIFITLKVEFLFYLIIGFVFLGMRKNKWLYAGILLGILTLRFIIPMSDILYAAPYFIAGIACSEIYFKKNTLLNYGILATILLDLVIYYEHIDLVITVIGICGLIWFPLHIKWLEYIGKFSYSLYLTHGLTAILLISLLGHKVSFYILFPLGFIYAIGAAYLYYLMVEKNAIKWSKSMKYR